MTYGNGNEIGRVEIMLGVAHEWMSSVSEGDMFLVSVLKVSGKGSLPKHRHHHHFSLESIISGNRGICELNNRISISPIAFLDSFSVLIFN